MKRHAIAAVVVAGAALAAPAGASADPPFAYPACPGQTAASFVRGVGAPDAAAAFGLSVQQAHNFVMTVFCGSDVGLIPNPKPLGG